jgi:hypothetical protein
VVYCPPVNTCCEAEEPKPSAALRLAPPETEFSPRRPAVPSIVATCWSAEENAPAARLELKPPLVTERPRPNAVLSRGQGGLGGGAAEAAGSVVIAAAVGGHPATAEGVAADGDGVLSGEAVGAQRGVAVVAAWFIFRRFWVTRARRITGLQGSDFGGKPPCSRGAKPL